MARQPTGNRPGAPLGSANALKHGVHSALERAEHLRAESSLRSVKALKEAVHLEQQLQSVVPKAKLYGRDIDSVLLMLDRAENCRHPREMLEALVMFYVADLWASRHGAHEEWVNVWRLAPIQLQVFWAAQDAAQDAEAESSPGEGGTPGSQNSQFNPPPFGWRPEQLREVIGSRDDLLEAAEAAEAAADRSLTETRDAPPAPGSAPTW